MPTLTDIATALGLNKTTVSKALRNSSDISEATKRRVIAEAERIGYTLKSERISKNRSDVVGIICPEVTSYYYAQVVSSLSKRLAEKNYKTLIALSDFSQTTEQTLLSCMIKQNMAGVILITAHADLSAMIHDTPKADDMPIVIMGTNYEAVDHDLVSTDDRHGIRSAIEHLIRNGHSKIAFLGDHMATRRFQHYKDSMLEFGLEPIKEYSILSTKRNEQCGYEGMRHLLSLHDRPSAVLAAYDAIALGAYRAITEGGLCTPEDIALVGYDDATFCPYLPSSLTSVNCDVKAESRIAVAILLNRIKNPDSQSLQTTAIVPRLIVRETSNQTDAPARRR